MATVSEILDINKPHIIGKILHAEKCGRISKITLPPAKDVITIKASDMEDARIKVLNDYIPIFAHSMVSYPGEPVLAVFGKTAEEVDLYMSSITIDIDESSPVFSQSPSGIDRRADSDTPNNSSEGGAPVKAEAKQKQEKRNNSNNGKTGEEENPSAEQETLSNGNTNNSAEALSETASPFSSPEDSLSSQAGTPFAPLNVSVFSTSEADKNSSKNEKQKKNDNEAQSEKKASEQNEYFAPSHFNSGKPLGPEPFGRSFRFSSGNISSYFKKKDKIYESEFEVKSYPDTMLSAQRIYANTSEGKVYISCASQWPLHVRDSVATALKMSRHDVIISPERYHTNYNHLLITPSVVSTIAAFAAKKTGTAVELQINISSWCPRTKFLFQTELDAENKPLAYRVRADIDFGAYPIFTEEICYNIMAGLIPNYKVNAFEININTLRSNTPPASFFVDAGFCTALAAAEQHFNNIINSIGAFPSAWRLDNLSSDFGARKTVIETTSPEGMKQNVEDCIKDSDFNRRFSAYNLYTSFKEKQKSVLPYSRGIGMSTGQGIIGFSSKFQHNAQYSVSLTLDKNEITVILGFNLTRYLKRIYRSLIQGYFDINTDKIKFEDINSPRVQDSGPNTLSRATGMVLFMLENACRSLKEKQRLGYSLPLTETSYTTGLEDAKYFVSCCSCCISVDMHIDAVKIIPVVDRVTARIKTGKIFDVTGFQDTIKHTITRTISEVCPCTKNAANIDLRIRSNPNIFSGFSLPLIEALTTTSLCTAFGQALDQNINAIPITEDDLLALLKKKSAITAKEK